MNKAKELLMECKIKLGIKSDYALAKEMEIDRARMSDYMNEKRTPDNFACMRIAQILRRDPITVIAEIEADTCKNETRRAFWINFLSSAKQAVLWQVMVLLCTFICVSVQPKWSEAGGFKEA